MATMKYEDDRSTSSLSALVRRLIVAAFGLFIFTFGIYVTLRANIGVGPWDVLSMGIEKQTVFSFGESALIVSATILILDLLLKEKIGPGTVLDVIITGKGVDLFLAWDPLPLQTTIYGGVAFILLGLTLMAIGQRIYMPQALGMGPRDLLMVALGKRVRNIPIGLVLTVILGLVILSGWLLGGSVGLGTLVSLIAAGPIMQMIFAIKRFDPRNVSHDTFAVFKRVLAKR